MKKKVLKRRKEFSKTNFLDNEERKVLKRRKVFKISIATKLSNYKIWFSERFLPLKTPSGEGSLLITASK